MDAEMPTIEQAFAKIGEMMGRVPAPIEKAAKVDQSLVYEHLRSRASAMPPEGALDEETRTLIYLAVALACGSPACVEAWAGRVGVLKIAPAKVLEALHIARFALATKVISQAGPLFEALLNG